MYYVYDETFLLMPNKPKVIISVKEGSLLPKDSTTQANQAIELTLAGKMSLVDLYKKLEDPNPEERAANVWLEVNAPHILYKDNPQVMEAMQLMQQQAQAQAQAQQQQEMQQGDLEHQRGMESKMVDHDSKMAQIQAQQEGNLLNRVSIPQ
jgi:hypothetical protein